MTLRSPAPRAPEQSGSRSRSERRLTVALKALVVAALVLYLGVAAVGFLAAIRTTGLLVVASLFFAYLVHPLVRRLDERLPLAWAIAFVYAALVIVATAISTLVFPPLADQAQSFARSIPNLVAAAQSHLLNPTNPILRRVPAESRQYLASLPAQIGGWLQASAFSAAQQAVTLLLSAFAVLGTIVVVPVLAAYMLLEAHNVKRDVLAWFPAGMQPRMNAVIDDLDAVVGGFIRGQLIDGAIVGAMIGTMLAVLHVPYALLIGVTAGALNFIPYAGAIVGFIPSVLIALLVNGPGNAAVVAIAFAVIQQVDGNLIAPRVLKENVGLSPLYIIVAIFVGTELFGLAGTFLAVPVAAMLRVAREHFGPGAPPLRSTAAEKVS